MDRRTHGDYPVRALITCLFLMLAQPANATDLRSAYNAARAYDAEIQAAEFDLEAARQRVPLARSAFRPQLQLGADVGITNANTGFDSTFREDSISLTLNQTIFNRSNSKLLDQAQLGVLQAEAQFASQDQALILQVANAYFDVLRAQANVEFSQSELQAIDRQREQANRRFDVGLVPITDVRSAQAQYDLAVAQEIAASNQLATAREALFLISGIDTEQVATLARDFPLSPPQPTDIDAWVKLANDQNIELAIARLSSESAQTQIDVERASRYPTVDLIGIAVSNRTEREGITDLDAGELRIQLSLPILTGGRIKAQIAQANAEAMSASQTLIAQERSTTQQTRDSYRGVLASISQVRALRQALVSTQQSAEATDAGFRAGTRTSVEVLQALRDTFRARSDYSGALYDYIINLLSLKSAAGTLNESDLISINNFLIPVE